MKKAEYKTTKDGNIVIKTNDDYGNPVEITLRLDDLLLFLMHDELAFEAIKQVPMTLDHLLG